MSERFEVKVEDFIFDQGVYVVIEVSLCKSFGVQASKDFINDLFAFVYVKIFVSVHEVTSILHVKAIRLPNVEEIF